MTQNIQSSHIINIQQLKYLQKMKFNLNSHSKIQKVLNEKQKNLKQQIQKGNMKISHQNPQSMSYLLNKSLSSSKSQKSQQKSRFVQQKQKKPFYISSHPQLIKQHYQRFQQLKKQYSHYNTSKVVKAVQNQIKGWMQLQKKLQNKRNKKIKQMFLSQRQQKQMQQKVKRKSFQQKKQQHKNQLQAKILQRAQKKRYQQQRMKEQNISKKMLQNINPLYKQKQKLFIQRQKQSETIRMFEMKQNKKIPISQKAQKLKQHQQQYLERIKQVLKNRRDPSVKKIKTEPDNLNKQFVTIIKDKSQSHLIEQHKKNRIKQYVQRLKAMSPDITTLQRIQKVKQQIKSHEKNLQITSVERNCKNRKITKAVSTKNIRKNVEQFYRQKIGNKYLKESRFIKIKTQNDLVIQQNQIIQLKQVYNEKQQQKKENESLQKQKNFQYKNPLMTIHHQLNASQLKRKSSPSPQKQQKQQKKKPSIQKSLKTKSASMNKFPSIQKRSEYKNYLFQLKIKPQQAANQIDKIKKQLRYPSQIMKQFNRMSLQVQKKMMAKIKQFKHLQKTEKYNKNLQKQSEIDQLYHKNLQLRLACLQLS